MLQLIRIPFRRRWSIVFAFVVFALTAFVKHESTLMPTVVNQPKSAIAPNDDAYGEFRVANANLDDWFWSTDNRDYTSFGTDLWKTESIYGLPSTQTVKQTNKLTGNELFAISMLESGLMEPYYAQPERNLYNLLYINNQNEWQSIIARGLRAASDVSRANGDWANAMRYDIDAINFGVEVQHGAVIQDSKVATGCEETGRSGSVSLIDHLTKPQAKSFALRLAAIDKTRVRPSQVFAEEKRQMQSCLLAKFNLPNWHLSIMLNEDNPSFATVFGNPYSSPANFVAKLELPRMVHNNYTAFMNHLITESQQPWKPFVVPTMSFSPMIYVNYMIEPWLNLVELSDYVNAAKDRLLETQLTLRAYKLDHGTYPMALDDLVPTDLPSVPGDPFSTGNNLRYTFHSAVSYVLYSVGPDGVNDNDSPIVSRFKNGRTDNEIYGPGQRGDIVAGVNNTGI